MLSIDRALALALVFAAPFAASGIASATVMLPMTIEEMTRESAAVVRARVLDQNAAWDEAHQRIYTTTRLEVLESIHATAAVGKTVTVRTLGGEVGEIGMKVAGTPQFSAGEEVLVFLRRDPKIATAFQVIGMSQGKYQVRREPSGAVLAIPSLEGLAFARAGKDGVLRPESAGKAEPLTLDELQRRILSSGLQSVPPPAQTTPPAQPTQRPAVRTPAPSPER